MGGEIAAPPGFVAWGPFVRDNYYILRVTTSDLIIAGTAFGVANFFALTAAFIAVRQTKSCRNPRKSTYIWMIWLELASSVALSIICLLYLLRIIRPSFYFFMAILVCWVFQIQLLPQIIINRIRIILQDKKRGRRLTGITAIIITLINISVFCIWIPARLQISDRWIHINSIWDRTEKVLFLLLDGYLNYYFIRVVNADLVRNGLTKYNRLVRFNKRMIVVSLSLDVMIIGAMSIPNGFVYAMFHPLAYIVKLNIEMSMAHLIKTIVLDNRHMVYDPDLLLTYKSSPDADALNTNLFAEVPRQRLSLIRGLFGGEHVVFPQEDVRTRAPQDVSIQTTSIPDSETPLRKPVTRKETETSPGDDLTIYEAEGNRNDDAKNDTGNSETLDGTEILERIPPIALPEPVLLPARMPGAD